MKRLIDNIKIPLSVVGAAGLGYGFYIYFNATDFVDNSDGIPFQPVLTFAMILVWLAAVLTLNQLGDLKKVKPWNPIKYWAAMFKGTPGWVLALAIACFLFGVVNSPFLFNKLHGLPGVIDGKYVIQSRGSISEVLTEQEFLTAKSTALKAITSIHILFLGMGTGILYPRSEIQ